MLKPSPQLRALWVAVPALIAGCWLLASTLSGRSMPAPDLQPVAASTLPPLETISDTLDSGETLAEVMAEHRLDEFAIHEIGGVIREHKSPRTLRPGAILSFTGLANERPTRLALRVDADTILHVARVDSGWTARIEVVPVVVDTVHLAGLIESNLWLAKLSGETDRLGDGEYEEFVYDLAEVYAWKIDFTRDIREGDGFRVAVEREVRPDRSIRTRRFLAIEFRNQERVLPAIPFTAPGGRREYYDLEGQALRGVFLRYPVPYRITSGFTNRRYHPILKRSRPHQGIDYGAPHGAAVRATASGTVTKAGAWGAYGKTVEIRHTHGIWTRYAHLSSIAVRPGSRVNQGQVIGRVGSTGLATGSHLHYEFIQNGRHRNPQTVNLPAASALDAKHMDAFRIERDAALALLRDLHQPRPAEPLIATTAPATRRR
jgi:murein DD-endopeptidase MepM/ murein hydrolase activator NlpD